jgi:hypothetical protein
MAVVRRALMEAAQEATLMEELFRHHLGMAQMAILAQNLI